MAPKMVRRETPEYPGKSQKSIIFATFSEGRLFDAFWSPVGSPLAPFWLPLAAFWLPLAPLWLTFGSFWLPLGTLRLALVPFCSLLVPFGCLLAPFCPPFGSLLPLLGSLLAPSPNTFPQHFLHRLRGGISRQSPPYCWVNPSSHQFLHSWRTGQKRADIIF